MVKKEFLDGFEKRMKTVGRYAVLCRNSFNKTTWKEYGIETTDMQMNLLFTVLLYIMEYSLREEDCTIDDIAMFLGDINEEYYQRKFSGEQCKDFARFLIDDVLGNSGNSMYFQFFDYESSQYKEINIRYIDNKVVYQEGGVRRTSYYLTEEGYNMVLATMELENNLKLTIHEMLFKLHLEKADYHKAVDDIRTIFGQLRKQSRKIEDAVHSIKRNALAYSVEEYRQIVEENIGTIVDTREKFRIHREFIEEKIKEFEEKEMSVEEFSDKEKENLSHLKSIGSYLTRTLDEHQRIFAQHFDLKQLYEYELENYANMTMVQRFSFRSELYDVILKDATLLEHVDKIFHPLFLGHVDKIFHPEKMLDYQKRIKKQKVTEDETTLDFDEDAYQREKEEKRRIHMKKYEESIRLLLDKLLEKNPLTIRDLEEECTDDELERLIPSIEIFREIIIEFLSEGEIDIGALKKEQAEYLMDTSEGFVLNEMLLMIMEEKKYRRIRQIHIYPLNEEEHVYFQNVADEHGVFRNFKCSNIGFEY